MENNERMVLLRAGKKPHACQHCGKRFALSCNLRAHLRTHPAAAAAATNNIQQHPAHLLMAGLVMIQQQLPLMASSSH